MLNRLFFCVSITHVKSILNVSLLPNRNLMSSRIIHFPTSYLFFNILVVQYVEGEINKVNTQIETLTTGLQAAYDQISRSDCTARCGTSTFFSLFEFHYTKEISAVIIMWRYYLQQSIHNSPIQQKEIMK